jgi:hypothetical protein
MVPSKDEARNNLPQFRERASWFHDGLDILIVLEAWNRIIVDSSRSVVDR